MSIKKASKPRLTHADNRATVVENNAISLQTVTTLSHNLGNALIKGISKRNVSNNASLEEGPWPNTFGSVDNLIRDDKVARFDSLLKTSHGGKGDDATHTNGTQSSNVGSGRHFVRSDLVVRTVAAQESHGDSLLVVFALVVQNGDGRRRFTPGGCDGQ